MDVEAPGINTEETVPQGKLETAAVESTVFTWLNAAATITLVPKIDAATIQTRPLLDTQKRCLHP